VKSVALFLLVALPIYAAFNSYVLWRLHRAFPAMGWWLLLPAGGLLLLVAGPLLVPLLARGGWPGTSRAIALLAHPWLAMVMWFVLLGLTTDAWNLAVRGLALRWAELSRLSIPPRVQLTGICAGVLLLTGWSIWEARRIGLEHLTVTTPRLPAGSPPIRIALIADLHLGALGSSGRAETAIRLLNEAQADIILSAGDLLDAPVPADNHVAGGFAAIPAPLGKFAVLGNHEFYAGPQQSVQFLNSAGFDVLRNRALSVGPIRLAGVDDHAATRFGTAAVADEADLLGAGPGRARPPTGSAFLILLKHRPDVSSGAAGLFDLQLSGHTHGGQVFPFGWLVRQQFPMYSGLHRLEGGALLYVSRGTGTWGPPMRLFARPEVAIITLVPADVR